MNIRAFSGADFDAAAHLLGTTRHAAHGTTSHWQGADELCAHLANTDHGFVALGATGAGNPDAGDKGEASGNQSGKDELLGFVLLTSPREQDHNGTLRMHWLQQRTRIAAMAAALGINARADVDVARLEAVGVGGDVDSGESEGKVLLLVVSPNANDQIVEDALMQQANAWLAERRSM